MPSKIQFERPRVVSCISIYILLTAFLRPLPPPSILFFPAWRDFDLTGNYLASHVQEDIASTSHQADQDRERKQESRRRSSSSTISCCFSCSVSLILPVHHTNTQLHRHVRPSYVRGLHHRVRPACNRKHTILRIDSHVPSTSSCSTQLYPIHPSAMLSESRCCPPSHGGHRRRCHSCASGLYQIHRDDKSRAVLLLWLLVVSCIAISTPC